MTVSEYVFVSGNYCETFCRSCGQLRLWGKPERPTGCGHCGSTDFVIGPLLGEELPKLRETWIIQRMKYYPCRQLLDSESELTEPMECGEPERYRAKGNEPVHAHLCEEHWQALPEDERAHYVRVDLAASARDLAVQSG